MLKPHADADHPGLGTLRVFVGDQHFDLFVPWDQITKREAALRTDGVQYARLQTGKRDKTRRRLKTAS